MLAITTVVPATGQLLLHQDYKPRDAQISAPPSPVCCLGTPVLGISN